MAKRLQLRRGTTVENNAFKGASGELTYDIEKGQLRVHNGVTVGGTVLAKVSEVPSLVPQATETALGVTKIATTAIAQAGVNDTDFITPLKLQQKLTSTAFGEGQTWQNMTASRVNGTTYTNSSTRPIMLSIAVRDGGFGSVILYVNSSIAIRLDDLAGGSAGYVQIVTVVPSGQTYKLDATGNTISFWGELR